MNIIVCGVCQIIQFGRLYIYLKKKRNILRHLKLAIKLQMNEQQNQTIQQQKVLMCVCNMKEIRQEVEMLLKLGQRSLSLKGTCVRVRDMGQHILHPSWV